MKKTLPALLLLQLFTTANSYADSSIFICMQPNGTREYRNTGDTRGCKKLDLPEVSTIPSPRSQVAKANDSADTLFPKIDSGTQKRRDQDRMQILMDEVRTEEEKLSALKKEYQNGEPERQGNERNYAKYQERVALLKDEVARTEKNIEALKREISNLK
jgi:hypothetical protein